MVVKNQTETVTELKCSAGLVTEMFEPILRNYFYKSANIYSHFVVIIIIFFF